MQALAAANTALSARSAAQAVQAGQGFMVDGKANPQVLTHAKNADGTLKTNPDGSPQTRDATAADKVGGINVSISLGSSSSQSKSTQTSDSARGSTVQAGNNLTIVATGAGQDSDITVQGSALSAGRVMSLYAQDQIQLQAARNSASQQSSNSSKSSSLGVSFGTSGLGVTASASRGRGNADGSDLTWTNSQLKAGEHIVLVSGGDTTLKGAVVQAPRIDAQVGGNLLIQSLK
jgi:filamentous hemagglutinin